MDFVQKRPGLAAITALVVGVFVGLFLGWTVWPVEWTNARLQDIAPALEPGEKEFYLRSVAELFSFDGDSAKVQRALSGWNGETAACQAAETSSDPADAARLRAIANVITGQGCTDGSAETPAAAAEDEEGGSGLLVTLVIVLVFLVSAIVVVLRRRSAVMEGDLGERSYADVPEMPPVTDDEGVTATPLARFRTSYTYGHDTYDDSFSIETANGDFLGECGVGISESIGTDTPKNVTAIEVWLFDKNDIRTVTKVVMSDHAFFDEALKAKLAPKGEPILARENETVVLETASLIINAEIKEMQYGDGVLPPQSFFERVTIELSTWAKDGDIVDSGVDEILNY